MGRRGGAASSTTYQKRPWCTGLVGERGDITVGILSEKKNFQRIAAEACSFL